MSALWNSIHALVSVRHCLPVANTSIGLPSHVNAKVHARIRPKRLRDSRARLVSSRMSQKENDDASKNDDSGGGGGEEAEE